MDHRGPADVALGGDDPEARSTTKGVMSGVSRPSKQPRASCASWSSVANALPRQQRRGDTDARRETQLRRAAAA